jgi:hypothetical protein
MRMSARSESLLDHLTVINNNLTVELVFPRSGRTAVADSLPGTW